MVTKNDIFTEYILRSILLPMRVCVSFVFKLTKDKHKESLMGGGDKKLLPLIF